MKPVKAVISIILVVVLAFSTLSPVAQAVQKQSFYVPEKGLETISTESFFKILSPISAVYKLFTGKFLWTREIEIQYEKSIATDLCDYILENSGLDVLRVIDAIPFEMRGLDLFYELTGADLSDIREEVYRMADDGEFDNDILCVVAMFAVSLLSDIETVKVYTQKTDNGDDQVVIKAFFRDGGTKTIAVDIYFNEDGLAYSPSGSGILLLGYNCSVYDLLIYATVDCWMKDFGFCFFYDFFCYTTPFFNYITRRFKFDYDGREWMVQVWKGNYLVTNGAECGIYNRDAGSIGTYYDCYDGTMPMSLKLSHGDKVIYNQEMDHWWINGFKLTPILYSPKSLTAEFSIVFPDEAMARALADSINKEYHHDVTCTIEGSKVTAVW